MFNVDFDAIRLFLASPDEILSWSRGEVTKPETINYRSLKPEKDGLFDERIFGPTKDYECYCGKYKRVRYKGVVCDKCGVEVTESRVRRERMGHITLATPVAHTWYFRRSPGKIALLLDLAPKDLELVIYFAAFLVLEIDEEKRQALLSGLERKLQEKLEQARTELNQRVASLEKDLEKVIAEQQSQGKGEGLELKIEHLKSDRRREILFLREEEVKNCQKLEFSFAQLEEKIKSIKPLMLLSETDLLELRLWEADIFLTIGQGSAALLAVLEKLDLEAEIGKVEKQMQSKSLAVRKKAALRLKLMRGFKNAALSPQDMILRALPVIPSDLRPMVQLPGGRFATSDLNDLYRRVINRNNRLKNLLALGAPEIILMNEKRMLQEAVDSLIEGAKKTVTRRRQKELRSLSEMLRGKQGRFRQNLLGKRVDYSGRSVIVVGPELKMDQVGLPKEMALELFKPAVLRELILGGFAPNLRAAKNVLEKRGDEVWDLLEKVTKNHPVLLNRAPTLHRQNIQAFYPILIEGSAIQLHPAVCNAYNADFDGDAMSVHVPLSEKAIAEAKDKLLSCRNFLKLADAKPIVDMKNEIALGLYYLTTLDSETVGKNHTFLDFDSALSACQQGKIGLREPIFVFWGKEKLETSAGRILLNEVLPKTLRFVNQPVSRDGMKKLIDETFLRYGEEQAQKLVDALLRLGRHFATEPGISFSLFDFEVPDEREALFAEADAKIQSIDSSFRRGLMTGRERFAQVVALWQDIQARVAESIQRKVEPGSIVGLIVSSRASRANQETLVQIGGMRGLMTDSLGNIKETPIRTAEIEGSTSFEGFLSAIGGRKGLIDTALLTADAGYLTRRLVDVAHDVLVREEDCKTTEGLLVTESKEMTDWTLKERIIGRTAAQGIKGAKPIVNKGGLITEQKAKEIIEAGVKELKVRSPLTCKTRRGVCQLCYGWDMGNRSLVKIGEAVGVIAAQSIGEPGTQLTLRTFYTGGLARQEITQGLPRVEELLEARIPKEPATLSELSGVVSLKEGEEFKKVVISAEEVLEGKRVKEERVFTFPATVELKVKDGDFVAAGDVLTSGHLDLEEIVKLKGLLCAQEYLLREVQAVYKGQGVTIHDKHFEIILRKMSDKARISKSGESEFLPGELVDYARFEEVNEQLKAENKEEAVGRRLLLGITKASLSTESWLSAASFINTANVLAATAVNLRPQSDRLFGLKENVIIGRLIPTGERAGVKKDSQFS